MATLQPYKSFRPTSFDVAGLALDEQQDWLVCPVMYRPKIAECAEESNWDAQREALSEAAKIESPEAQADGLGDFEICRFGHWATTFEIAIVRPGSECARVARELAGRLEDYPLLNEDDVSERENEQAHTDIASELASLTLERDGLELDGTQLAELAAEIHSHMADTNTGKLDQVGQDGGGGPGQPEVEQALRDLDWCFCQSDDTWRPVDETIPDESSEAGASVNVRAHSSEPGNGLSYAAFDGTLLGDCNGCGWDVVDVKRRDSGEIESVYSFDVSAKE